MDAESFRRLYEDVAAIVLPRRAVVAVRGTDPLALLEATTSRHVADLAPGHGALACLLDAKGLVQAEVRVLPLDDETVLLDGEEQALVALTGSFARVAPLSGCEVEDRSDTWETLAVRGPAAPALIAEALGAEPPAEEHAFARLGDALVVRVEWGVPGFDVLAPAGAVPPIAAPAASVEALEAARIAAGRPRFGVDVTAATFVNETPLLSRAVTADKGCYPGQESVARVRNLGRIRKRLAGLRADGESEPPRQGTPVTRDGAEVGTVTSAATIPGAVVALAVVRAEVEDGAAVDVGGLAARVRDLG